MQELRTERRLIWPQVPDETLPATVLLDIFATDMLKLLPKITQENQCFPVLTDRYSKLPCSINTSKTISAHMANLLTDPWIVRFDIAAYLLTDNGPQSMSKFISLTSGFFGRKHLGTTAYHPQRNCQSAWCNQTIVGGLQHYVAD